MQYTSVGTWNSPVQHQLLHWSDMYWYIVLYGCGNAGSFHGVRGQNKPMWLQVDCKDRETDLWDDLVWLPMG